MKQADSRALHLLAIARFAPAIDRQARSELFGTRRLRHSQPGLSLKLPLQKPQCTSSLSLILLTLQAWSAASDTSLASARRSRSSSALNALFGSKPSPRPALPHADRPVRDRIRLFRNCVTRSLFAQLSACERLDELFPPVLAPQHISPRMGSLRGHRHHGA